MNPHPSLPERFTLQRESEALVLSWPLKRTSVLPLLLFLCCCPSPCGLYGQALVEGEVALERNGSFEGYVQIPWLGYLLMAGAILFIVLILFVAIISRVNHSTLRAEPGRLRVRHWPIPLPRTELLARDIVRFEPDMSRLTRPREPGKEAPSSSSETPPAPGPDAEYRLNAITRSGKSYRVVSALETLEQCAWVERELRRALGMQEQGERG